jgi:hypothetical protein
VNSFNQGYPVHVVIQAVVVLNLIGYKIQKPKWFLEEKIVMELDVREILAAGVQPVNKVIVDFQSLQPNSI